MKKLPIALILCFMVFMGCTKNKSDLQIGRPNITPKPAEQKISNGHFEINAQTTIAVENEEQQVIAHTFFDRFMTVADWTPSITIGGEGNITFAADTSLENEAHTLDVSNTGILIKASTSAGFFYALQSLKQIMPLAFYKNEKQPNIRWGVPAISIMDSPAFEWRGYMLDVSRHFFDKEKVKEVLDFMAESKLNRFHWHLTDDQGWRVEIKQYPKLTEVGAWRADYNITDETISNWWGRPKQKVDEKATYGGFYTQEDIKEIVAYAKDRFIEVIPEIDMPGHAQAAVAAYPEIGCVHAAPFVATGGVAKNNTINPGKEETYTFVESVLNEVMDIFPYQYIHIGGDECNKSQWREDPYAQKRMKEEGLKNEHELQSYFIKRLENIVNARGRTMIGWDEILEGGLAPNATVMSWRGEAGGITSAKAGHEVIMTPSNYCYLDLKQGHDDLEPNLGYSELLLSTTYNYKVIPESLSEDEGKLIKGIQANMWTESISDWGKLTYMTFPRLYAVAENGWTAYENKNWDDFSNRLLYQFKRLDAQNVRYAVSAFSPWIDHKGNGDKIEISLHTEINGLDLFYTLDDSEPTLQSIPYKGPFSVEKSIKLKARAYKNGEAVGYISALNFPVHLAAGTKAIDTKNQESLSKITDLSYAKANRGDPAWQRINEDSEIKLVFEQGTKVREIQFSALQWTISGIYPPEKVEIWGSEDGNGFTSLGLHEYHDLVEEQGRNKIKYKVPVPETTLKALKIRFKNLNPIPQEHHVGGGKGVMFIDEIMVN